MMQKWEGQGRAETGEWGGQHPGYRVQVTFTVLGVFINTNTDVTLTGGTVDTMVAEAGTRLDEFPFWKHE